MDATIVCREEWHEAAAQAAGEAAQEFEVEAYAEEFRSCKQREQNRRVFEEADRYFRPLGRDAEEEKSQAPSHREHRWQYGVPRLRAS